MLVEEGRIDEAIKYGQHNLFSPDEALTLAKALQDHDRPQAALEVAQHGETLDGTGKAEVAEWLRDRASSMANTMSPWRRPSPYSKPHQRLQLTRRQRNSQAGTGPQFANNYWRLS